MRPPGKEETGAGSTLSHDPAPSDHSGSTAEIFDDGSDEPIPQAYDDEEETADRLAEPASFPEEYYGDEEEPLFMPPLYIQRYCAVEQIIELFAETQPVHSIMDLGCAELKFVVRAKNGKLFQRIIGVDCDEFLVGSHCRHIRPTVFEMINKRDNPLKIEVYAGDATRPDQRLLDIDVVTAIELIEHMELETHAELASTVFGIVQPKLVIFTTPNVEYNPLFPGGSMTIARHWDHRFEWTRAQFQNWAKDITEKYPAYTVQFHGVGYGPVETLASHGCCSQIAVFMRDPTLPKLKRCVIAQPYRLMSEIDYPWAPPKTLTEEIFSIIDGECYSMAKELQEEEEAACIYHHEWFTFTVDRLYQSRWRLQSLLETADLEQIRVALRCTRKDWLKFDEENDKVSYKLELQLDSDNSSLLDSSASLEVENDAAGISFDHYSSNNPEVYHLEELEDAS